MVGNLISQYCAACFKRFPSEQNRKQFKAYLLATIKSLIETYMKTFTLCWERSVKERYRGQQGLLQSILQEVMVDMPGYASMVNWFRSVSDIPYPDFDVIENKDAKRNATVLSLMIDWGIMFGRYKYQSADDLIETIIGIEEEFRKSL